MELTANQRYWKAHLDALVDFEGTVAEYAQLHSLDKRKLYDYKSRWRRNTNTASFVQVKQTTITSRTSSAVTVALPNGVRLSLPDLNAPGLLERLARL